MNEVLIVFSVLGAMVIFLILDKKYGLGLNSGLEVKSDLGLPSSKTGDVIGLSDLGMEQFEEAFSGSSEGSQKQIQDLKQRVEVLERIVTSSDYNLKQQIDALK